MKRFPGGFSQCFPAPAMESRADGRASLNRYLSGAAITCPVLELCKLRSTAVRSDFFVRRGLCVSFAWCLVLYYNK